MNKDSLYDMSADIVIINDSAMLEILACAVGNAKEAMNKAQSEIDNTIYSNTSDYSKNHHMAFYSRIMARKAKEYSNALEMYHAYYEHVKNGREIKHYLHPIDSK